MKTIHYTHDNEQLVSYDAPHCIEIPEHFLQCYVILSSQNAPDFWVESTSEYIRFDMISIVYKSNLSICQLIFCHSLPTNSQSLVED